MTLAIEKHNALLSKVIDDIDDRLFTCARMFYDEDWPMFKFRLKELMMHD